jgi:hypothetical protein
MSYLLTPRRCSSYARHAAMLFYLVVCSLALAAAAMAQSNSDTHPLLENGHGELIVTFSKPLNGRERGELTRQGVRFIQALSGTSYLVKTRLDGIEALEGSPFFVSAERLSPESKLSDGLAEGRPGLWAVTDDGRIEVVVQFYDDVSLGAAVSTLRKHGIDPGHPKKLLFNERLIVTASLEQVNALAASLQVRHIGTVPPPAKDTNVQSAQIANVDIVQAPPYSLDGDGVLFGMWESGNPRGTHEALAGRITAVEGSVTDHGTHVGGTILGDGTGDATALGMSPSGDRIFSYTSGGDTASEQSDAVNDNAIVISNHSWGNTAGWELNGSWSDTGNDNLFGLYNGTARDWDAMVRATGLIVNKASGNDGNDCDPSDATDCDGFAGGDGLNYGTITTHGNAKNIITVGALNDDGVTIAGFSSNGPSDDDRIKPDLVANGTSLWSSCFNSDTDYCSKSGTSMATPSITGATGLLVQRYRDPANYGTSPGPDVIKALWVNTAADLGRPGPDYVYGHGLIDAQLAVDTIDAGQVRIMTDSVDHGDTNEYLVSVPSGVSQLRATLNWLDPEASAGADPTLVNDLDLLLVDWEFNNTFPFSGPGAGNVTGNATATGPNTIDTVEHALVANPAQGFWKVRVAGTSVPDGPQSYALVVNGFDATGQLVAPFGFALDSEPDIRVNAQLDFNEVCPLGNEERVVTIFNIGGADLLVNSVTVANTGGPSDAFSLGMSPTQPFIVKPGAHVDVTVRFAPDQDGDFTGQLTIESNDADEPTLVFEMTGSGGAAAISTFIADSGDFGEVCSDTFKDLNLTVQNNGSCDLQIDIVSLFGANPGDFELPGGPFSGTIIEAGNSLQIPVRFAPDNFTDPSPRTAGIEVASRTVGSNTLPPDNTSIQGSVPPPDIGVIIANSGDFGNVCKGDEAIRDLRIFNHGACNLLLEGISLLPDNGSFQLPDGLTLPRVISPDAEFTVPVVYAPEDCDDTPEQRTIVVESDDPDQPEIQVPISGTSPCPNLVIDPASLSGLYAFPATVVDVGATLGCFSDQNVVLRNTSVCPLTIDGIDTNVADFSVIAPTVFPVLLPGGEETHEVTVRFTPQSDADPQLPGDITGVLSIDSDDPDFPHTADLCGESVTQSGIRTLVTDVTSGVPILVEGVDSMTVKSKGKNTPSPINLKFSDVQSTMSTICGNEVYWHLNLEMLPATETTGSKGGKSQYEVYAKEGNLQDSRTFPLDQCEFSEFQMQLKSTDGGDGSSCPLGKKGDACDSADDCCSGKCTGKAGAMTCK